MPAPKADPARCDIYGCGHLADMCTDGSEVDSQGAGRKALPNLNVCARHENWPFSEDARTFAQTSDSYKNRGQAAIPASIPPEKKARV
jgi:hypothetical protein